MILPVINRLRLVDNFMLFWQIKYARFFAILLMLASSLNAAPLLHEPTFIRLSTEHGLSQDTVNSLLLDQQGFLWLGTESGLNRYDGYQTIQIPGENNEFSEVPINYLFQDSSGFLWVATLTSGVYKFDISNDKTELIFDYKLSADPDLSQVVGNIIEDKNGNIWFAMEEAIARYSAETGVLERIYTLPTTRVQNGEAIRWLWVDAEVAVIATSNGVLGLDLGTQDVIGIDYLQNKQANIDSFNAKFLMTTQDNTLWIGTVEGLYSLPWSETRDFILNDQALPSSTLQVESRNIWRIVADGNQRFYLATDQGLFGYDIAGRELQHIFLPTDSRYYLSDDNIYDLKMDNKGNLWLGTKADGALYWSPKTTLFSNIFNAQGGRSQKVLSHNNVWSISQQNSDTLWIGTDNGLNKYNLIDGKSESYLVSPDTKAPYSAATIKQIIPVDQQQLWLVTDEGLLRFDTQSGSSVPLKVKGAREEKILRQSLWGVSKDDQGDLWFTTNSGFFRYSDKTGEVLEYEHMLASLIPSRAHGFLGQLPNHPEKMLISSIGQLWQWDTDTNKLTLLHELSVQEHKNLAVPTSWLIDKDNIMWVSYPGFGLVGLDAETFAIIHIYTRDNLLPSNNLYGLQKDGADNMWMSSHAGLLKISPDSLHIQRYGQPQGLANVEFNQGASTVLQDGRIAYGSPKGFTLFDPADFNSEKTHVAKIRITEVALSTAKLNMPPIDLSGQQITLTHEDIGLSIRFSTLEFEHQNTTRYAYQLVGSNTVDYPVTRTPIVVFPKLTAGQYDFVVTAFDMVSGEKIAPAMLKISVLPAPWRSTLAYILYALTAATIIYIWYLKRRKNTLALRQAHHAAVDSKNRLTLALTASNSDIWECNLVTHKFYAPRLAKELGYKSMQQEIDFTEHLVLIHEQDRSTYENNWQRFIERKDSELNVTYRMQTSSGNWLWYRDSGSVIKTDNSGKTILVTGTYTNVTETMADQQSLRLFGEAFKHTHDWVVICNSEQQPIAVNDAFSEAFHLDKNADLQLEFSALFKSQTKETASFLPRLSELKADNHWKGEDQIAFLDGRICDVLVHINAVANVHKKDHIEYYLVIVSDITEQKAAKEKLLQLANFDSLTGLPNRALLLDRICHAVDHANRHKYSMAVFFIDLDRFKQVNDSLGHKAGDELLKIVAQRLTNKLRKDDTVARLGGDEFVILIEDVESIEEISALVSEVSRVIDLPVTIMNQSVSVSSSIGIAMFPGDGNSAEELLKNADIAMYHAKEQGRSNFQFFTEKMDSLVKERLLLENQLKECHLKQGFENYYQAIVDSETGRTEGFEILMRWPTENGMIPPDKFIPISEELGLIEEMTLDAFERAMPSLKEWRNAGFEGYLSVNLSAKHFENQSCVGQIMSLLTEFDIPVSAIRFEITESALMRDYEKALGFMQQIQQLGFIIALDDFGTGYSSLKYLKEFPINIIKVDKSFVEDIGKNKNNEAIIRTTLSMAEQLDMSCVAEGIETEEQVAFFSLHKCHHLQGYLFSKPVPAAEVFALAQKQWKF